MSKIDEGTCARCGKEVTRRRGERWHDQYGRDRCRADYDDGEYDVREFRSRKVKKSQRIQSEQSSHIVEIVLYGKDSKGQPAMLAQQVMPAVPGITYHEVPAESLEVTSWSIRCQ